MIRASAPFSDVQPAADDGWAVLSGTSASSPQVAGICALLKQAQPGLPPDLVKAILDPFARGVHFPASFDRGAAIGRGSNAGKAPLGVLRTDGDGFDWGADRRPRHESDLVVYEMHVRGFTVNPNSGVSDGARGTYAGVIEKIPYLKELGVTAVELMPVHEFDPQEGN